MEMPIRRFCASMMRNRLVSFAAVGAIGFLIEALFLTLFAMQSKFEVAYGRLISFPLAVIATWVLNRRLTFKSDAAPLSESVRYILAQTAGALCNLAVFYVLTSSSVFMAKAPAVPLLFAAVVGLAINFMTSRIWVFR